MKRLAAPLLATLLAVGLIGPVGFATGARANAADPVPRVVFIVGPAGVATSGYRAQARAAAAIARKYTPDVVEVYSPNATWPAVKEALAGASLVIYMGHGNGWPSRYRDALYPVTQNGFGLNPVAGGDDSTHQYFGEAAVGSQIKLARDAVVLLNHLCYASGLTEPGLPEGTIDQAMQRVDNFAAGFIKAGASAVVAEAWSSPSYMVRAILGGSRSIETAWRSSPSANGNRFAFPSVRSPGFVAEMDPETATSGFTRSIVLKAGLAPRDVLAGSAGSASHASRSPFASLVPAAPTLVASGLTLKTPDIAGLTSAATTVQLRVPFTSKGKGALPKILQASVRWDRLDPVVPAGPSADTTPAAAPSAASPGATPAPNDDAKPTKPGPRGSVAAAADSEAIDGTTVIQAIPPVIVNLPPAGIDLVVPEIPGDVVAPAAVKIGKKDLAVPVTLPTTPGRYRLTITLHDGYGVAYDPGTQAMLPPLIVRVTGDFDGAIVAAPAATLTAGTTATLQVQVANLGQTAWGHEAIVGIGPDRADGAAPAAAAMIVGHWIPLSVGATPPIGSGGGETSAELSIGLAPGATANASLALAVPSQPGEYLLVLDIVTPERGSLVAAGADPTLVRISVVPGP